MPSETLEAEARAYCAAVDPPVNPDAMLGPPGRQVPMWQNIAKMLREKIRVLTVLGMPPP